MVSELLTQADKEFQQGNFDLSSELYSQAIGALDLGASKELAVLLQKLADSDYAREKYELALQSYESAVALHQTDDFAPKERVSVLLKTAKTNDKCAKFDAAEAIFQDAYELAKSSLTPEHFLSRTVRDAYAEWLKENNRNPELFKQLQSELGIEAVEEAEVEEEEERRPEDIVLPTSGAKAAPEQEVFVLRARLSQTKKEEIEDKPTLELKAKKLTVEQEVTERKFLRKNEEKNKGGSVTSRRQRLRSTFVAGRGTADGAATDEELTPEEEQEQEQERERGREQRREEGRERDRERERAQQESGAMAAYSGNSGSSPSELSDLEIIYPAIAELKSDAHAALGKVAGMKPQRSLRSGKKGVDLIVPVESAPLAGASKNFLQQAEAVKKASEEDFVAPDVEALRANDAKDDRPMSHKIGGAVKFLPPVLGLIMLIGVAVFVVQNMKNNHAAQMPLLEATLLNHTYTTADGAISLLYTNKDIQVKAQGSTHPVKFKLWNGDVGDEMALMRGRFDKCKWLVPIPQGLRDADGVTFYSDEAPERKTIAFMKAVADEAQGFFLKNGHCSTDPSELTQTSYMNPYTNRATGLVIKSAVETKNSDAAHEAPLDLDLEKGGKFKNEPELTPGAVHAYSVSGHPHFMPDRSEYVWELQSFYIHGADRDSKLLAGSEKDQIFLLALKNGQFVQPGVQSAVAEYANSDICMCEHDIPDAKAVLTKYILFGLSIVFGITVLLIRSQLPALMARSKDGGEKFVIPD